MTRRRQLSRRTFLKSSALISGAAVAAPYLIPGSVFGANEKIVTGHIGVGGQGEHARGDLFGGC